MRPADQRVPLHERLLVRYARGRFRKSLEGFRAPLSQPRAPREPVLLYLHVPFCEEPCVYCSFHRVAYREEVATPYYHALREEMRHYADRGYHFDGLSVGGGTPTVLPRELERTVALARELWPIREVTVETNPTHLGDETVGILRDAGVQRLSVGVQSLSDDVLTALGRSRYGTSAQIRESLRRVRGVLPVLNVDLIFGYPGQTADALTGEIRDLRELEVDQLTFYPIMYSTTTRKALRRRMSGLRVERLGELYRTIRRELAVGYHPNTAWSFARGGEAPLDEYISGRGQYAGLGAGSFSLIRGALWATIFSIPDYIRAVTERRGAVVFTRKLSPIEIANYTVLMGLFRGSPRPLTMIRDSPPAAAPAIALLTAALAAGGALSWRRGLAATARGAYASVLLMREFFQGVNDFRDHCRGVT